MHGAENLHVSELELPKSSTAALVGEPVVRILFVPKSVPRNVLVAEQFRCSGSNFQSVLYILMTQAGYAKQHKTM